uniref:Protein of unassigned function n=1 Tax=Methylobacterium oryzae CBMB20 TaxID=693986 RepID=A0A088B2C5_9HYPH|nr:protein of unassigned function [Methylobacterium oryzae CBMB20]
MAGFTMKTLGQKNELNGRKVGLPAQGCLDLSADVDAEAGP